MGGDSSSDEEDRNGRGKKASKKEKKEAKKELKKKAKLEKKRKSGDVEGLDKKLKKKLKKASRESAFMDFLKQGAGSKAGSSVLIPASALAPAIMEFASDSSDDELGPKAAASRVSPAIPKKRQTTAVGIKAVAETEYIRRQRSMRFEALAASTPVVSSEPVHWGTVVGTCQSIEKQYLRLTSAPVPSMVRPPEVLVLALLNVKERWRDTYDYEYCKEQLKSIRQDITVQNISDQLTLDIYETHARMALEAGDLSEFNQCQAQLREFYDQHGGVNQAEFYAYRILYCVVRGFKAEVMRILGTCPGIVRVTKVVQHSLQVMQAIDSGNFNSFFRLYKDAPKMNGYIMDHLVDTVRLKALTTMMVAFSPTLETKHVRSALDFTAKSEFSEFLRNAKVVMHSKHLIDTVKSRATIVSKLR